MAYINQERKQELAPGIKRILAEYGVKGTLSVRNNAKLVLKIKSGPIDFIGDYNTTACPRDPVTDGYLTVNKYWVHEHFSGRALEFLTRVLEAMNVGNHDNSDASIDFFDIGWHISIHIGTYDRPYQLV